MEEVFKINRNMFGGYNKKQTLIYMNELKKLVEETRAAMEVMETENESFKQNIAEAEKCYTTLWEQTKELEETVKAQEKVISQQRDVIDGQKKGLISMQELEEAVKAQEAVISQQRNIIDEQKKGLISMQELAETVKAQEEVISQQRDIIADQKKGLTSMKEHEMKQEQNLKRMLEKLVMNPVDDMEQVIRKQLKRLQKKRRKKEKNN